MSSKVATKTIFLKSWAALARARVKPKYWHTYLLLELFHIVTENLKWQPYHAFLVWKSKNIKRAISAKVYARARDGVVKLLSIKAVAEALGVSRQTGPGHSFSDCCRGVV
jgi:hypothetical protein